MTTDKYCEGVMMLYDLIPLPQNFGGLFLTDAVRLKPGNYVKQYSHDAVRDPAELTSAGYPTRVAVETNEYQLGYIERIIYDAPQTLYVRVGDVWFLCYFEDIEKVPQ